jgi:hypothetical protein
VLQGEKATLQVVIEPDRPGIVKAAGTLLIVEKGRERARIAVPPEGVATCFLDCPERGERLLNLEFVPDSPDVQSCAGELKLTVRSLPPVGEFVGSWQRYRRGRLIGVLTLDPSGSVRAGEIPPGEQAPNTWDFDAKHNLFALKVIDENDTANIQTMARGRVQWGDGGKDPLTFRLLIIDGIERGETDLFNRVQEDGP